MANVQPKVPYDKQDQLIEELQTDTIANVAKRWGVSTCAAYQYFKKKYPLGRLPLRRLGKKHLYEAYKGNPEQRDKIRKMVDLDGCNFAEIGRTFGITRERVRQIYNDKNHS